MSLSTSIESLLAGTREDIDDLAEGDVVVWQALFEHLLLKAPPEAPAAFVGALLAVDPSYLRWMARAEQAASQCQSDFFVTAMSAVRPFRQWFAAGVVRAQGVADAAGLEAREDLLLHHTGERALEQASALVREAQGPWAGKAELGRLLLLWHRRATEEHQHALALEAATEAAVLFRALGDAAQTRSAERARAAAMLRLGQLEPALELLDGLLTEEGPLFGGGGSFQFGGVPLTPGEQAADEAATIAAWAKATTPEWVRALGGLAETHPALPSLWTRYEGALRSMLEQSKDPRGDLEVVLRQAAQRDFTQAQARARVVAAARGITLPEE